MSADITRRATEHVEALVARGSFDAVNDLARVVPVAIVLDLLGFPEDGRDRLLNWAESSFNVCGPVNQRMTDAVPVMQELFGWLTTTCTRDRMVPGGFATTIHQAAERGDIPEERSSRSWRATRSRRWTPRSAPSASRSGSSRRTPTSGPRSVRIPPSSRGPSTRSCGWSPQSRRSRGSPTSRTRPTASTCRSAPGSSCSTDPRTATTASTRTRTGSTCGARTSTTVAFGLGTHSCPGQGLARLDPLPAPIGRVLGPEIGRHFVGLHHRHGTQTRFGLAVESVEGAAGDLTVRLSDGTELPAATVAGIGAVPNDAWLGRWD